MEAPELWIDLKPGPYQVGFRASLLATEPHPLQISVWYPAERGTGDPLTYRDYLLLNLTETSPALPAEEERAKSIADAESFLTTNGVSVGTAKALMAAPMYARKNAAGIAKRFPLVFVVQGNGQSASGQAVLSEFLASHGYVVATIPSVTRLVGQMQTNEDIVPRAEAEERDIERAVAAIRDAPNVISSPITLVAHSFGARAAMFYAMHNPVNALVSLEGGIGTATGRESMLESKMLDLTAPFPKIMHFYELNDDRITPDFKLLKSLRSPDIQYVRMNSLRHVHFSSDGFAAAVFPDMGTVTKAGPDVRNDVVSYAQQTLDFINKQWASTAQAR